MTMPILTGPPPAPEYCNHFMGSLPTVRWSLRMLQWVGWTYCETFTNSGHRWYNLIDPAGLGEHMSTNRLRRVAMRMHFQYGTKAEKNFDLSLDTEPGF